MVGIGGFLGANARYVVGGWITRQWETQFPWGTFVINITGSFLLGILLAVLNARPTASAHYRLFFAVGFLGAYTTFSTWMLESWRLVEDGAWQLAAVNLAGSVGLGLVAVVAGLAVGRALP